MGGAENPGKKQSKASKEFVAVIHLTSDFLTALQGSSNGDCRQQHCVRFGDQTEKNCKKCVLITFNTKREEKVVDEVDYRLGCALGCVNGECVFF